MVFVIVQTDEVITRLSWWLVSANIPTQKPATEQSLCCGSLCRNIGRYKPPSHGHSGLHNARRCFSCSIFFDMREKRFLHFR